MKLTPIVAAALVAGALAAPGSQASYGVLLQTSVADHGSHNRIVDNAIEGKGIQVNPGQVAATIARNTINATAGDGIVVHEPSTILQGNAAAVSAPNGAVDNGA